MLFHNIFHILSSTKIHTTQSPSPHASSSPRSCRKLRECISPFRDVYGTLLIVFPRASLYPSLTSHKNCEIFMTWRWEMRNCKNFSLFSSQLIGIVFFPDNSICESGRGSALVAVASRREVIRFRCSMLSICSR
jgi:hypothetical protein